MDQLRARDILTGLGVCTAACVALKAAYATLRRINFALGPIHVRKYKWSFAVVTGGGVASLAARWWFAAAADCTRQLGTWSLLLCMLNILCTAMNIVVMMSCPIPHPIA